MTAPSLRGKGTATPGGATSVTLNMSVTAQSGDAVLLFVARDGTDAITWPSGFVEQKFQIMPAGGDGGSYAWALKRAGGSEPSSYAPSWTAAVLVSGAAIAFQNVSSVTMLDVAATTTTGSGNSPWSLNATGLASGNADRLLIHAGSVDNGSSGTVTATAPSASPATWTEEVDISDAQFTSMALYTATDAAGTFTTNVSSTHTQGVVAGAWTAFLIAIAGTSATSTGHGQLLRDVRNRQLGALN